jgi:hypothetical protein
VSAQLAVDSKGRQYLKCEPDMADLWVHSWSH